LRRGVAFPGLGFYLQIGLPDYAWSATSASNDVVDEFAETLCGNGVTQYMWRGQCRDMTTFDAGTLMGQNGAPDAQLTFRQTVHGRSWAMRAPAGSRSRSRSIAQRLGASCSVRSLSRRSRQEARARSHR
jgi:hypothetical protein